MFKNNEGIKDPTAGLEMSNVMREYREKQKKEFRRKEAIRNRKKVYVISRFAGDIDGNIAATREFCRFLIMVHQKIPIASHLLFPQMFAVTGQTGEPTDIREIGLLYGLALMKTCDEAWVFTNGQPISEGMEEEIREAKKLGIPVIVNEKEVDCIWK